MENDQGPRDPPLVEMVALCLRADQRTATRLANALRQRAARRQYGDPSVRFSASTVRKWVRVACGQEGVRAPTMSHEEAEIVLAECLDRLRVRTDLLHFFWVAAENAVADVSDVLENVNVLGCEGQLPSARAFLRAMAEMADQGQVLGMPEPLLKDTLFSGMGGDDVRRIIGNVLRLLGSGTPIPGPVVQHIFVNLCLSFYGLGAIRQYERSAEGGEEAEAFAALLERSSATWEASDGDNDDGAVR